METDTATVYLTKARHATREIIYTYGIDTGLDFVGVEPGTFIGRLLHAWQSADTVNHFLLCRTFPEYAIAMNILRFQAVGAGDMLVRFINEGVI